MSDYAATAKNYEELAEHASDPELVEAYRNLASGYQLLAHGSELLERSGYQLLAHGNALLKRYRAAEAEN